MITFNIQNFNINKWFYFTFKNNSDNEFTIQESLLIPSVLAFYAQVISPLIKKGEINKEMRINIIAKVSNNNSNYRSIIPLQTLTIDNVLNLNEIILAHYNTFHMDNYNHEDFNSISFNFRIMSKDFMPNIKPKTINVEDNIHFKEKPFTHKISNINLPLTMDLYQWGSIKFNEDYSEAWLTLKDLNYYFEIYEDCYYCTITTLNDDFISEFRDILIDKGDLSYFRREIRKQSVTSKLFIIKDFEIIFKAIKHNPKFLRKINKVPNLSTKLITLDIETKEIDQKLVPICISLYDGKKLKSFFINDYKSSEEMLTESIKYLNRSKYNGYKVYAHNFSGFDSIFLLSILSKISKIDVKIREGVLIEIICKFNKNTIITFRDSYLLLTSSLDKLGKSFLNEKKKYFPYDFINKSELNYEGEVPDITFFNRISLESYNEYKSQFSSIWNLKNETIKYCESDVILLHKIIRKFSFKIFQLFKLDILNYPTLPSLAFAIYRSNFLKTGQIPLIHNKIYEFISKSYTGGHVDLYHHYNKEGEKVYRYDVNSLYPFSMLNNSMPIGNPIQFEGNILDEEIFNQVKNTFFLEELYGFFEANVTTPSNLNTPVLLNRMKIDKVGYRTIAPLGTWTGIYHSDELFNSLKYGYKFTSNKGYLFERDYIFTDYVNELYKMKCNSQSGEPEYVISKLLLNALYGRFGMNPKTLKSTLLKDEELDLLLNSNDKITVYDKLELENDVNLITYYEENSEDFEMKSTFVNVAIASSITAYSRIYMSKFKNLEGYKIFYSDTDSIDLDKPLPEEYVGKELGKFKLEHIWKKVIYISNKAYIGIDKDNNIYQKLRGVKMSSSEYKKNPIKISDLEKLLLENSELKVPQQRWYKSFKNSSIQIKNVNYTLAGNDNKRISIIENGVKTYTVPIKL